MDSQLAPGMVFGRDFRVVSPLRAGGMGAVYIVEQLSTGKHRALKVMAPELAQDPAVRERFVLEARAAAKIESDHVVEIVIAGVDEATGSPYLVMELLKGQELADALEERGALPLGDVSEVLSQVGHALEQAHAHGIVHRDLKPENVFLCASKRRDVPFTAKVLDFGIAKLVEDSRQKTGTQPLGTPLFMAPEQTDRRGRICPATDVWALGLIAFKLLANKDFWREADGSLAQLLREIVVDPIPTATERARELGIPDGTLPPGFDAWFARCVDRDVDARFPDAGAATRAFVELCPAGAPRGRLTVTSTGVIPTGPAVVTPAGGTAADRLAAHDRTAAVATGASTTSAGALAQVAAPSAAPPKRGSSLVIGAVLFLVLGGGAAFFAIRGPGGAAGQPMAPVSAAPTVAATAAPPASATAAADGTCPAGMVFVRGGNMVMGAKDASEDAKITHKVTVASFCLDKTEVTVAAYQACVDKGDCERAPGEVSFPGMSPTSKQRLSPLCNARREGREQHPVNCVDWTMAKRFCDGHKWRLPTEAEWEFAARGSSQRTYPWGDEEPSPTRLNACGAECVAWGKANQSDLKPMYEGDDKYPATAPVGSFPEGKSAAGALDLAGNVWEWTSDWYGPYSADALVDPTGPGTGTERVVRGGAFNGWMAEWAKPAYRWKMDPTAYSHGIGFRCAAAAK